MTITQAQYDKLLKKTDSYKLAVKDIWKILQEHKNKVNTHLEQCAHTNKSFHEGSLATIDLVEKKIIKLRRLNEK